MRAIIFIADDDLDDQEIFCETLSEIDEAICCITANNGEEALHLLKSPHTPVPDFIFLDLNMPRMDGRKCLQAIKGIERLCHIPIIIYSTSKLNHDIEEMRKLRAVHFITKPNKLSELRQMLSLVLAKSWEKVDALY